MSKDVNVDGRKKVKVEGLKIFMSDSFCLSDHPLLFRETVQFHPSISISLGPFDGPIFDFRTDHLRRPFILSLFDRPV